jgi:neutral ceramidase
MMAYPDTHGIQSEELPNLLNQTFNLSPLYRSDQPHLFKKFGSVINDIEFDTYTLNKPVISCSFVAGNPRNDPMIDKTFLTVEKKKNDTWETVLTDHDYETRYTDWFGHFFFFFIYSFFSVDFIGNTHVSY